MRTEHRIIKVRVLRRWGPARIAFLLGLNPATVHRVLTRYHLTRLAHLNRATGRPIRRYEHEQPGDLIHVDIKKLGNIPDGGGHRIHGRALGKHNSSAHRDPTRPRKVHGRANLGYHYLHNAVDDHSRLAYTEILADETRESAAAFWTRAHAFFAAQGITVKRVLTDNGSCYRSHLWRDTLTSAGITHKRTRPRRPQTNGKVERFNRTMLEEWAYATAYQSETERRQALPAWLHSYNHHRGHTALNGLPPASRVPNLSGQYSYPVVLLLASAALSLSAQLAVASPSPSGWLLSAVPALAFMALVKLVFATSAESPSPPVEPAPPPVDNQPPAESGPPAPRARTVAAVMPVPAGAFTRLQTSEVNHR